jgi:hypothetical protein
MKTIIAVLSTVLLSGACSPPESTGPTWEPLDFQAYKARFLAPTGEINAENIVELFEQIEQMSKDLEIAQSVGDMLSLFLGAEKPGAKQGALTLENTNLYVKLSCFGPNPQVPDLDFGHGHLRIDSPNISEAALFVGDALMSFNDCILSESLLRGKSPAYYDLEASQFAMGIDITLTDLTSGLEHPFVLDLMVVSGELWALIENQVGNSFGLMVDPAKLPASFSLKGSNGVFSCYIKKDKLGGGCDGPGDLKFEVNL